mmetsp:Transcript_9709/g.20309  ORF Transcript_9709/g.20309 Transcript_9709/m.20309 type:complete len:142 (+) Transcript_9709:197-622(+)|eukprot:CAMPEP_0201131282 /NCGR_PEP_ID=MMETSP0850-20130426/42379_1 /ASSEMBLY_ACC=CAM_ASM_000622 /TAXON_ID=183588 /ORGANISM="Pseudo-nitzschia fraudulenta, Strain WWA7" /LENGTH=141 /DNA_ID=CAMNT_0047401287 /DNA_START=56 /DNA_END=481 /DNA_ORIENTATION=+
MNLSKNRSKLILVAIVLACLSIKIESFASTSSLAGVHQNQRRSSLIVVRDTEDESPGDDSSKEPTEKMSLEEKMKSWEASEEEIRAASLGGVVPQGRERTEAFDVGLYIAFPIMVLTGLAFAFFPFIMGNIDVSNIVVPTE